MFVQPNGSRLLAQYLIRSGEPSVTITTYDGWLGIGHNANQLIIESGLSMPITDLVCLIH